MPDAYDNFKGIALSGKAGETWERIFGDRTPEPDPRCPWQYPTGQCPIDTCMANTDGPLDTVRGTC